jgi:hypothetical protein
VKKGMVFCLVLVLLLSSVNLMAQNRKSQKEVFGGFASTTGPDFIKDYFKTGFSPHAQYVIFPKDRLGISFGIAAETFTFDDEAFLEDLREDPLFGSIADEFDIEGDLSIVELGVGVRPYLTNITANKQIFLLGSVTMNVVKTRFSLPDLDWEEEMSETKVGLAFGAGIEIPAGDRFNMIFQALIRSIPSVEAAAEEEDEDSGTLSFIGITAGLVF